MALANRASFIVTRQRRTVFYAITLRVIPGSDKLTVEIQRAPDSAGAPNTGAAVTLGEVGPFPIQGSTFLDLRANDGATWWYRCRHTGVGNDPGNYTGWVSSTPRRFSDATSDAIGDATNVYPVRRTSPLTDGDYAWRASDTTGNTGTSTNNESGGKRVNRLFAKPLSSDPDTIDSAPDGSSYAKIFGSRLASGVIKRAGALDDGDYTVISSASSGQTVKSTVNESGGKAVNRLLPKPVSSDPDTLDSVGDGSSYKRIAGVNGSNLITPSSTSGRNRVSCWNSGSNLACSANTQTAILFNSENFDVGGLHDTASNTSRITIPTGGGGRAWAISWQALLLGDAGTTRIEVFLKKNGTIVAKSGLGASSTTSPYCNGTYIDVPSDADYYEIFALFTGATGSVSHVGGEYTWFAAVDIW